MKNDSNCCDIAFHSIFLSNLHDIISINIDFFTICRYNQLLFRFTRIRYMQKYIKIEVIMKRILLVAVLLMFIFLLDACVQEDDPDPIINPVVLRDEEREDIILDFDLVSMTFALPTESYELHSMIADSVIFQQEKEIRVFGKAEPGTIILVKLTKDFNQAESTKNYAFVPENGEWIVTLPALSASFFTYTLTISDTVTETLIHDVLIGEVWLMSGQSNMELKVSEMDRGLETYGTIHEEYIRVFTQLRANNNESFPYEPRYDVTIGQWKKADSYDNIMDVSGIGMSFAISTLYNFISQSKQVPVAIINTAIGGSQIHAWLPRSEITESPVLKSYVTGQGYNYDDTDWNVEGWNNYNQVSALYNSRIAPLTHFNIRGVAWYQGESDPVYSQTIEATERLIDSWSAMFNKNDELLNFALIQLAPYDGDDPTLGTSTKNYTYTGFALHRRAQFDIINDPKYADKVFVVPIYDINLKWNVLPSQFLWANAIHPVVKIPVGDRLSKMAMSFVYLNNNQYLAPIADEVNVGEDSITIHFINVGSGLMLLKNQSLGVTTVEVFDFLGRRLTVEAEIDSSGSIRLNNINVSSVRYVSYSDFTRNEESNLASSYGIPALPFHIKID